MAEIKISNLQALTTPATNDLFVAVDVSDTTQSASGTTKKITGESLFATPPPIGSSAPASGAFTTLSATGAITGGGSFILAATTPSYVAGQMFYDAANGTFSMHGSEPDITLQIGQESWISVRNETGVTILDGTPVYISGANGNMPLIMQCDADTLAASQIIGICTHDIENNTNGFVTAFGLVRNLNTVAFPVGSTLYVSQTSGALTATSPVAPAFVAIAGVVTRSHVNLGAILVTPKQAENSSISAVTGLQAALDAKVDDTQISAYGLTLADDADAATARATLGLGTAATSNTGDFAATVHTHTIANVTSLQSSLDAKVDDSQISAYGLTLVDDATAAAARTTLGLGTAATSNTGDFAALVHTHTIADVTSLQSSLDAKVDDSQVSAFGLTLIDDAAASNARTTLGLGTASTSNTGDFAATAHTHAAADVTSGTMAVARLGTGTPTSSTFLRGDGAWQTIPGGGDMLAANNLSDVSNAVTSFTNIKQAATTTATGVVELATSGESAANLAVQANDARLSDARTPLAHVHSTTDITSGTMDTARLGSGVASASNFLRGDNTWAIAGSGSVTSVALTMPSVFSVMGSPVTSSGTFTVGYSGAPLPVANGGTGINSFGSGIATFLGTPSSANLISAVTDETGSGSLVFSTSPTLVSPALGTPSSGTLSACTVDGTNKVGFLNVPISGSSKTTAYTMVLGDVGKLICLTTGGSVVVPAGVFAAGDSFGVYNDTGDSINNTCSAVTTAYLSGTNSDIDSFACATRSVVMVLFTSATSIVISGGVASNYTTTKAIFGYGYTGSNVSITNLVSNTGVVSTDTTGVGTARNALAAAGYGTDKAIFGYGSTGPYVSMTNLVSSSGVVSADVTGVGTARQYLAAAGYSSDKAIFGYGTTASSVSMTNLVSNTGVVSADVTGVGTARYGLGAAKYGTDKAIFTHGGSVYNLVSNTGVVSADVTLPSFSRNYTAAASYGADKALVGYGLGAGFVNTINLISNTGVVASDTAGAGTARNQHAAAGYGSDKAIFGYGWNGSYLSMTNLVSNAGVVAADTTGVGSARYNPAASGYSIT